jgi:non-ribosomal peptide synthetase component E (peptide arylation enzyme)
MMTLIDRFQVDGFEPRQARRHLAANKYPRQITIVPAVPLTTVGKLDRKKLRQWVADAADGQAGR